MRNVIATAVVILIIALAARRRRRREAATATPRSGAAGEVRVDDGGITLDVGAERRHVAWSALRRIHVETVAGGLNADDVTWVVAGSDGEALRISQTARGADHFIARLQQLDGFRYEPMIESMITTEATEFVVWEKKT